MEGGGSRPIPLLELLEFGEDVPSRDDEMPSCSSKPCFFTRPVLFLSLSIGLIHLLERVDAQRVPTTSCRERDVDIVGDLRPDDFVVRVSSHNSTLRTDSFQAPPNSSPFMYTRSVTDLSLRPVHVEFSPSFYSRSSFTLDSSSIRYVAPELTGQRGISRSTTPKHVSEDLFSVGMILLHLWCGERPYHEESHIFHLLHAILTTELNVPCPCGIGNDFSPLSLLDELRIRLCAIIRKLVEKRPHQRYRSTTGVLSDLLLLARCHENLSYDSITPFILGTSDSGSSDVLSPLSLVGHDRELFYLVNTYSQIQADRLSRFVIIEGSSGVGKTRLVSSFFDNLFELEEWVFVLSGKCEPAGGLPFEGVRGAVDAFLHLVQLCPENEQAEWREEMERGLGTKGIELLAGVFPSFGEFLGLEKKISSLALRQQQEQQQQQLLPPSKYPLLFMDLMDIISSKSSNPIVFVLDDLQWLDESSAALIHWWMTQSNSPFLFLATHRPSSSLRLFLKKVERVRGPNVLSVVQLRPLSFEDSGLFLEKTLEYITVPCLEQEGEGERERVIRLIYEQSKGVPQMLLHALILLCDSGLCCSSADDISEFLFSADDQEDGTTSGRPLVRLLQSSTTQGETLLKVLSLLGNNSPVSLLISLARELCQSDEFSLRRELASLESVELVNTLREGVSFAHDKVRDVVLLLMGEDEKLRLHPILADWIYRGIYLTEEDEDLAILPRSEMVCRMVYHYSLIMSSIEDDEKRLTLARACLSEALGWTSRLAFLFAMDLVMKGIAFLDPIPDSSEENENFELSNVRFQLYRLYCNLLARENKASDCDSVIKLYFSQYQIDGLKQMQLYTALLSSRFAGNMMPSFDPFFDLLAREGVELELDMDEDSQNSRLVQSARRVVDESDKLQSVLPAHSRTAHLIQFLHRVSVAAWMNFHGNTSAVALEMANVELMLEARGRVEGPLFSQLVSYLRSLGEFELGYEIAQLVYELSPTPANRVCLLFTTMFRDARWVDVTKSLAEISTLCLSDLNYVSGAMANAHSSYFVCFSGRSVEESMSESRRMLTVAHRIQHDISEICGYGFLFLYNNFAGNTATRNDFEWNGLNLHLLEKKNGQKPSFQAMKGIIHREWSIIYTGGTADYDSSFDVSRPPNRVGLGAPIILWSMMEILFIRIKRNLMDSDTENLWRKLSAMKDAPSCAPWYHLCLFCRNRDQFDVSEGLHAVRRGVAIAKGVENRMAAALLWEEYVRYLLESEEDTEDLARFAFDSACREYDLWGAVRKSRLLFEEHSKLLSRPGGISPQVDVAHRLSDVILGELNLLSIVPSFLTMSLHCLDADQGYVLLHEGDEFVIRGRKNRNAEPDVFFKSAVLFSQRPDLIPARVVRKAVSTQAFVHVTDAEHDALTAIHSSEHDSDAEAEAGSEPVRPSARSYFVVPLIHHRRQIVAILVASRNQPGGFEPRPMETILSACTQVALHLQNAMHVRQIEISSRNTKALIRAMPVALREDDYSRVLPFMHESGFLSCEDDEVFFNRNPSFFPQIASLVVNILLSDRFIEIFGRARYGRGIAKVMKQEDIRRVYSNIKQLLLGNVSQTTIEIETTERQSRTFLLVNAFLHDSCVLILAFSDITQLRETERKLRQKERAEVEERHQRLHRSIGQVAHEIRNPLMGVLGGVEMLKAEYSDSTRIMEIMERMECAISFQRSVLDMTCDVAKLEEGRLTLNLQKSVDLGRLIHSTLGMLDQKAERNENLLYVNPNRDIPDDTIFLITDPLRVGQCIVNLTANACKFTTRGEIVLSVDVRPASSLDVSEDSMMIVSIEVRDTGIGMTEDEMSMLFGKFQQANSQIQATYGGSGLGLFLSQELAHLLGGEITVKSEKGVGSTFTFRFCAATSVNHSPESDRQIRHKHSSLLRSPVSRRLWFAEDDRVIRRILQYFLADTGLEIRAFVNGEEFLQAWEVCPLEQRPDLICLDFMMPLRDGISTGSELRQRGCTATMILLTGNATEEYRLLSSDTGFHALLGKPVEKDELLQTLRDVSNCLLPCDVEMLQALRHSDVFADSESEEEDEGEEEIRHRAGSLPNFRILSDLAKLQNEGEESDEGSTVSDEDGEMLELVEEEKVDGGGREAFSLFGLTLRRWLVMLFLVIIGFCFGRIL